MIVSPIEIINKKKRNIELSDDEIEFMIKGYTNDDIPDYQMSAFLMAIYFNGMTNDEVSTLTKCMVESGDTIDLSFIDDTVVDKHSTGGVGDKVSIIIIPLIASLNIPIIKMSGKDYTPTGKTRGVISKNILLKIVELASFRWHHVDRYSQNVLKDHKLSLFQ